MSSAQFAQFSVSCDCIVALNMIHYVVWSTAIWMAKVPWRRRQVRDCNFILFLFFCFLLLLLSTLYAKNRKTPRFVQSTHADPGRQAARQTIWQKNSAPNEGEEKITTANAWNSLPQNYATKWLPSRKTQRHEIRFGRDKTIARIAYIKYDIFFLLSVCFCVLSLPEYSLPKLRHRWRWGNRTNAEKNKNINRRYEYYQQAEKKTKKKKKKIRETKFELESICFRFVCAWLCTLVLHVLLCVCVCAHVVCMCVYVTTQCWFFLVGSFIAYTNAAF